MGGLWRAFAWMTLHRLATRPGRALLIVAAVAGGVAMAFAVQALNQGQQEGYDKLEAALGEADRQVAARTTAGFSDAVVAKVRGLDFVDAAAPLSLHFIRATSSNASMRLGLVGVDRSIASFAPSTSALERIASAQDERANGLYLPARIASALSVGAGDRLTIRTGDFERTVLVARVLSEKEAGPAASLPTVFAPLGLAQGLTDSGGRVSRVLVAGSGGWSDRHTSALQRAVGDVAEVRARGSDAKLFASVSALETQVATLFGLLTLLIAALLVYNVAALDVADRRKEFLTLRLLGASDHVIYLRGAADAAILGLAGSALGIALGLLFVKQLAGSGPEYLSAAFLIDSAAAPSVGLGAACILGGVAVAVVGNVIPTALTVRAIDASGLGEFEIPATGRKARSGRLRVAAGALLLAVGAGAALFGDGLAALGLGLALVGAALLMPEAARAGIAIARSIAPSPGGVGAIGVSELIAAPARATALAGICALCVGAVVFIGGTSKGLISGVGSTTSSMFSAADLWISVDAPENNIGTEGFDVAEGDPVSALPEVAELRPYRLGFLDIGDRRSLVIGYAPGVQRETRDNEFIAGDRAALSAGLPSSGEVALSDSIARELGARLGETFTLETAAGAKRVRYVATIRNYGWQAGALAMGGADFADAFASDEVTMLGVVLAPGSNLAEAKQAVRGALGPGRPLRVEDRRDGEVRGERNVNLGLKRLGQIELAVVIGALLALTAGFAAAVVRRARQYSFLRASGISTLQLSGAIAAEVGAVLAIGSLVGAACGVLGQALFASVFRSAGYPVDFAVSGAPFLVAGAAALLIAIVTVACSARLASSAPIVRNLSAE